MSEAARTAPTRQLAFNLPHRPALGREDFWVAQSNEAAVAQVEAWPDWPGTGLAIVGPRGSGKTHLAHVFAQEAKCDLLDLADVSMHRLDDWVERGAVAFDCPGAEVPEFDQEALFHLFNAMKASGGHILIAATEPPARWPVALKDLQSRLATFSVAQLGPPDDALLGAVLMKHFSDRQLRLDPPVLNYLLTRMDRSLWAAGQIVAALDQASLEKKRKLSVALARGVLEAAHEAE